MTLRWALLLIISLFIFGCTAAVRYSPSDGSYRRADLQEPRSDSTNYREFVRDDEVRVESDENDDELVPDEQLPATEGDAQIDKSIMNRIISRYLNTPYEKGGSGKMGLDCSGFVYCVFRDYDDTRLPLSVQSLYRLDLRVDYDDLSYGDLMFFRIDDRRVSHVGIYLGNGRFAHASETRGVVIDDISDEYFATRYAGARRVSR